MSQRYEGKANSGEAKSVDVFLTLFEHPFDVEGAGCQSVRLASPGEGTAGAVEIGFFGTRAATSIAPPPGMVEHAEISKSAGAPKVTIECADDVVAVGAIGTRVATASASTQNIGQVVLLVPAP